MTEPEIRKFLSSQGLIDEQTHFQMLQGGYLNSVWRIDTAEKSLVAKEFKPPMMSTLCPNLPQDEVNALQRLEGLNVAPDLVGFWPEVSLVVYGYVEGDMWKEDTESVAKLLLRKGQGSKASKKLSSLR